MKALPTVLGLLCICHNAFAGLYYGVNQIPNNQQFAHYPIYVQMGSFSTISAAKQIKGQLQGSTRAPVVIQSFGTSYKVIVGPFPNASALKSFSLDMKKHPVKQELKSVITRTPPASTSTNTEPTLALAQISNPGSMVPSANPLNKAHAQFSVLMGGSYIPNAINGQRLQLLPYEIGQYADTFRNQSSGSAFTWGLDAQYRYKLETLTFKNGLFDTIGLGINFFQITDFNQTGQVLQFNMPEFTNYTYKLHLNNSRIMANVGLDLFPLRYGIIPFIEGGVGGARTAISYDSTPIPPIDSPQFALLKTANWQLASQAGAGVKYPLNNHWMLALRYLYANMGKVESSMVGSSTNLATPLSAKISTQNALLSITYIMG